HDAAEIDAHRAIPRIEVRILGIAATADACVVAQDVDLAERLDRRIRSRSHLLTIAHVRLHEAHGVEGAELPTGIVEILGIEVDDHDLHAELQEVPHHAEADATGAARHERDATG